jgi:hypothetical protein
MRTTEMRLSIASDREDGIHLLTDMNRSDDRYSL